MHTVWLFIFYCTLNSPGHVQADERTSASTNAETHDAAFAILAEGAFNAGDKALSAAAYDRIQSYSRASATANRLAPFRSSNEGSLFLNRIASAERGKASVSGITLTNTDVAKKLRQAGFLCKRDSDGLLQLPEDPNVNTFLGDLADAASQFSRPLTLGDRDYVVEYAATLLTMRDANQVSTFFRLLTENDTLQHSLRIRAFARCLGLHRSRTLPSDCSVLANSDAERLAIDSLSRLLDERLSIAAIHEQDLRREYFIVKHINDVRCTRWWFADAMYIENSRRRFGEALRWFHIADSLELLSTEYGVKLDPITYHADHVLFAIASCVETARSGKLNDGLERLRQLNLPPDFLEDSRFEVISAAINHVAEGEPAVEFPNSKELGIKFALTVEDAYSTWMPPNTSWLNPDLAEMLIITAPEISNSIQQRNFGKVSVEHAALSQSPEHLNHLLEHLLDENSVGETVKLLWVTPARRVLSSTLLNRCLASESPAVALAAARHVVRADLRGRIRDDGKCSLTRLAASEDQELRYTALSLLAELRDANDNVGLVLHETADSDTQFLQHLIVKSPEYCDESIAPALASDNCWIALRSADVLLRFAASDRSSRKTLEDLVYNSNDLFILDHIARALPKEDPLQRVIRMKR